MRGTVDHDDDGAHFELTPEQEDAIEESIAEIERGECITAEEMLAELVKFRARK